MSRRNKTRQIVWHYTYSHNIKAILDSCVLLPPIMTPRYNTPQQSSFGTDKHNSTEYTADAKMLLFSEREDWEPASYRGYLTDDGKIIDLHKLEDYAERGIGVFRIGVPRSILHPYIRLKEMVKLPSAMARGLAKVAYELGSNPFQWWGTTKPIPSDLWESVQMLRDGKWEECMERIPNEPPMLQEGASA